MLIDFISMVLTVSSMLSTMFSLVILSLPCQTPKTKATVFKLCSLCLYLPQDQLTCWGVGDIEDHLLPYMPD